MRLSSLVFGSENCALIKLHMGGPLRYGGKRHYKSKTLLCKEAHAMEKSKRCPTHQPAIATCVLAHEECLPGALSFY